jgi:hypothetical protein
MAEYGYSGKILRVDLSSGKFSLIPTSDYSPRFLGGRGIAAKIYWDEVYPPTGALDPDNRLFFMTGLRFPGPLRIALDDLRQVARNRPRIIHLLQFRRQLGRAP